MTTLPKDISFGDPAVQRCRFAAYDVVRELGPVYHDPGTGFYMVIDHDLARSALRDTEHLSSEAGQVLVTNRPYQKRLNAIIEEHGHLPMPVLSFADPPVHTYQRALFEQVFTIHRVREMEGYLEDLTNEIIDRIIDKGQVEFFAEVANVVSCTIISDQVGLPRSEIETFKRWAKDYLEQANQGVGEERDVEIVYSLCEMQTYLARKAEEYMREPGQCMLSDLVTVEVEGHKLGMREIVSLATILLIAGIGTTRSALCSAIYRIATTPGLEDTLRDDNTKIAPFIEELLRLEGPIQHVYRKATRDFEIGGVSIPANAIVCVSVAAANRDAGTFKCPADLDLERKNMSRHLSFGHGPHLCVGKELGRAEVRITLRNLLNRVKNIRLTEGDAGTERAVHFFQHSFTKLPISFDRI